jgi:serine protease Do
MIQDLQNFGYVTGAYLGVLVLDVDATAQFYGVPAGAYVEDVTAGGAAEKGGILPKDIITEVGGYAVTSVSDLTRVLRKFHAGDTVSVEIYRNGRTVTLSVTLDEKPHEETQPQQPRQELPQANPDNQFQDWYDIFKDYFG